MAACLPIIQSGPTCSLDYLGISILIIILSAIFYLTKTRRFSFKILSKTWQYFVIALVMYYISTVNIFPVTECPSCTNPLDLGCQSTYISCNTSNAVAVAQTSLFQGIFFWGAVLVFLYGVIRTLR